MSEEFLRHSPRIEDYWRGIVLFGRNVASYKFALAKSLLEIRPADGDLLKLEDLAVPFSRHICDHLREVDVQGTSTQSRFLDACRRANSGELSQSELVDQTVRLGFTNVVDAFHVVGAGQIPQRFFMDERETSGGIRITESFSRLLQAEDVSGFPAETEARWKLVEQAWEMRVARGLLTVVHDREHEELFMVDRHRRRKTVTSSRPALNGYQKGRCFYCFRGIAICGADVCDVDHFLPHVLVSADLGANLDGVWNLVLACRACNRGPDGKFDRVPSEALLERLHRRNEYLIASHHPLRETLIQQTGATEQGRRSFLSHKHAEALNRLFHRFEPRAAGDPTF